MIDPRTVDATGRARPFSVGREEFTRRVLVVAGTALLLGVCVWVFARAYDLFCLFFLAILLAILLRGISGAISRRAHIHPGLSLTLVVLAFIALIGGLLYVVGALILSQLDQFTAALPNAIQEARASLQRHEWGRQLLANTPPLANLLSGGPGNAASHLTSFFSTTLGVLGNLIVLAFLSLFLAAEPRAYVDGALRLFPMRHRPRAAQVMAAVGYHLWWWMIGQLVSMAAVGVVTGLGLWIIGIPQFIVLAIVAGLFTSVPYVGAITSVIPALLLAFVQGTNAVLWTMFVYALAHALEGYVLSPLVQRNTVELPPALTIMSLALIGSLFGFIGLIAAAPLMAAILVVVKMVYVEDTLGDRLEVPGENTATLAV